MADYSRPASGFRFSGGRMKTNSSPDNLPEDAYSYLQNTRFYGQSSCTSRPPLAVNQAAPGGGNNGPVLSLEPTIGVYKIGSKLFVAGVSVDTGYTNGQGCSIAPFRPSQSPNPYDYVFDQAKSSKVFVNSAGMVTVQKTGIAEPQSPPDACPDQYSVNASGLPSNAAGWTAGGTAGALSDQTRVSDTVVALFADPASVAPSISTRYSMQVGTGVQYQIGEILSIAKLGGGTASVVVQDVMPPVAANTTLTILSIFYLSGNTGRCVIVPSRMPIDNSIPDFQGLDPVSNTIASESLLGSLRRGSLISIGSGGTKETVFVLSATSGPTGLVAFECVTVNNHVATEALSGLPAITVSFTEAPALLVAQAITAAAIQSTVTAGTGTASVTISAANNPFAFIPVISGVTLPSPQQDDYVHVSVLVSDLTLVTNFRIFFDVGDGSFTQNYFYYDVQPSALVSAVANTQSQLAGAQLGAQQAIIRSEIDQGIVPTINPTRGSLPATEHLADLGGNINTSGTTTLGVSQFSEIMFSIRSLTRVGNDQSKSLSNVNACRVQVTVTNTVTFQFSSVWVGDGANPDVGDFGVLYFYRVRGRSSITGAKGNPSPSTRYGVDPRRQRVIVSLPSAAYDSQIDTWDVFRFGGSLTTWRYIGSSPSSSATYTDNVFDDVIAQSELLEFDNLEPFPSVGPPIMASSATIVGTAMTATFPTASASPGGTGTLSQLGAMLPGNLINVGQQVFTLFNRPTFVSSAPGTQTYLFRFVESAGTQTSPLVLCQEPNLAAQGTNRVWGPDANGKFFAVEAGIANNGNVVGLRPGLIQWTNGNAPDSASDINDADICPPSEPLQNGALLGFTSCVASAKRWWRGFPQTDGTYSWNEIPVGAGLAAWDGICSDGERIYFVALDGIRYHSGGPSQSLTNDDLYNLFPHEGLFPQNVTNAGQTVFAPEYKYAANFRLRVINRFLYFDYLDSTQTQRTLVCDLRKNAWSVDVYATPATIHAGTTNPASNQLLGVSAIRNQQLFIGDTTGAISVEQSNPTPGAGESVSCVVVTREEMVGDIRANKMFGDAAIDVIAASTLTIAPIFLGTLFGTSTVISGGQTVRPISPPAIDLQGIQLKRSMGLSLSWTDQGVNTSLFLWQISYFTQPEDTSNRITDWSDAGTNKNKFVQGFILTADSGNNPKNIAFRNGDSLALSQVFNIQHNGQQTKAYSFSTPISCHLIRMEPQDFVVWRMFGIEYIYETQPEATLTWATQGTAFGMNGYIHLKEILAAYSATAPVTLTITAFDGVSPAVVTLPSTGGAYQKALFQLSPNKGLLYTFAGVSSAPWSPYLNDWECKIKQWGSNGPYQTYKNLGDSHGDQARL